MTCLSKTRERTCLFPKLTHRLLTSGDTLPTLGLSQLGGSLNIATDIEKLSILIPTHDSFFSFCLSSLEAKPDPMVALF